MSNSNVNDERDGFWDIEKLIPKKKTSSLSPFATRPMTSEHIIEAKNEADKHLKIESEEKSNTDERRLTFALMKKEGKAESVVYHPENSLIKSITVRRLNDTYDFYDGFRKAAILYFDCPGSPCEFAQFFSYMPQYSQLTKPQKDYYLYWRSEMRKENFIKTDYSYIYLYVYEIINLPDLVPPTVGIKLLCRLWKEYRKALPRIDLYFSIWVQDYCMVHNLPYPTELTRDFIFDIIRISTMQEFYFTDIMSQGKGGVWALIAYLSEYDWTKGVSSVLRQVNGEEEKKKHEIYMNLMEGAFRVLLPDIWQSCLVERKSAEVTKITRNAFQNTLCTHSVKCKLDIEYYTLSNVRIDVTGVVRYIENKIRAVFGVKSRLAIRSIPEKYKELIDCYFADMLIKTEAENKKKNAPAYERLYDAPKEKLSLEGADEIERVSWDITVRLCDNDIEDGTASAENVLLPESSIPSDPTVNTAEKVAGNENNYGLSEFDIGYIGHLLDGTEIGINMMDEQSAVERINEAFADGFGDVIIEETDDGFKLIEDYEGDITEWYKKIMK